MKLSQVGTYLDVELVLPQNKTNKNLSTEHVQRVYNVDLYALGCVQNTRVRNK